ncbi:MAG: DUF1850 domain-containing protein [Saccharospirillum sp.]
MTRLTSLETVGRKTRGFFKVVRIARLGLFAGVMSAASPVFAWQLEVVDTNNHILARAELADEEDPWCLLWNHSVQGFQVEDCFRVDGQTLILDSTHTPDFAAGLGHIPGRGALESDDQHGYRITNFNQPLPGNQLVLRVGSMRVNHRIAIEHNLISLSELAFDQRVIIRLAADEPTGSMTP